VDEVGAGAWSTALADVEGIGFVFTADDPSFGLDLDDELSAADRAAIALVVDTYTKCQLVARAIT